MEVEVHVGVAGMVRDEWWKLSDISFIPPPCVYVWVGIRRMADCTDWDSEGACSTHVRLLLLARTLNAHRSVLFWLTVGDAGERGDHGSSGRKKAGRKKKHLFTQKTTPLCGKQLVADRFFHGPQ